MSEDQQAGPSSSRRPLLRRAKKNADAFFEKVLKEKIPLDELTLTAMDIAVNTVLLGVSKGMDPEQFFNFLKTKVAVGLQGSQGLAGQVQPLPVGLMLDNLTAKLPANLTAEIAETKAT